MPLKQGAGSSGGPPPVLDSDDMLEWLKSRRSARYRLLLCKYQPRGTSTTSFFSSIMSKLLKEAAAFKSTLHRQDYTSWHSQPKPTGSSATTPSSTPGAGLAVAGESSSSPGHKKKRPKTSMHAFSLDVSSAAHGERFNC